MADYPSVKWTGENVEEVKDLAEQYNEDGYLQWGFTVGSPYHKYRWYHRLINTYVMDAAYTVVRPYWNRLPKRIKWFVLDGWSPKDDPKVLEVLYFDSERRGWTTLLVGDIIYLDGSIIRGNRK